MGFVNRYKAILFLPFFWAAYLANAQDMRISATFQDQTLASALEQLREQYKISLAYDFESAKNISIKRTVLRNEDLPTCFQKLLQGTGCQFEILPGNYVVVKNTPENSISKAPVAPNATPPVRPTAFLCGTIKDADSGEILPGASISVGQQGVMADEAGFFKLTYFLGINDSVCIRYLGFMPLKVALGKRKQTDCSDFLLPPNGNQLHDIIITDRSMAFLRTDHGTTHLATRRLGVLPGYGEPDALRMVQVLPGVTTVTDKVNEISFRGAAPDQTLVRWNGIPTYHTAHMYGMISSFNPAAVESVSVAKGYFPTNEMGRTGGIIDVNSAATIPQKKALQVGGNLLSIQAGLQIPFANHKAALLLAARRSFTDVVQSVAFHRFFDFTTTNTRISNLIARSAFDYDHIYDLKTRTFYDDYNGNLLWQPDSSFSWQTSVLFAQDLLKSRFDVRNTDNSPNYVGGDTLRLTNWGLRSVIQKKWSPHWSSQISVLQSNFDNDYKVSEFDENRLPLRKKDKLLQELRDRQWTIATTWQPVSAFSLSLGAQGNENQFNTTIAYTFPDSTALNAFYKIPAVLSTQTVFLQTKWNIMKTLLAEGGVRLTKVKTRKNRWPEPRFALFWRPNPERSIQWKAAGGQFLQFTGQSEGYNNLGLASEFWTPLVTPDQPLILYRQVSGGFSVEKKGWLLDAEVWWKKADSLTTINLTFLENYFDKFEGKFGKHRAVGLDLLLRKNFQHATSTVSYGFMRSRFTFIEENNGQPFFAPFEIPHNLTLMQSLEWRNWQLSAAWNWRNGRPLSEPTGIVWNDQAQAFFPDFSQRNNSRLTPYHRLDASLKYVAPLKRCHIQVGLGLFNLYNRTNISHRFYAVETRLNAAGQSELFVNHYDRKMLMFTPMLFGMLKL